MLYSATSQVIVIITGTVFRISMSQSRSAQRSAVEEVDFYSGGSVFIQPFYRFIRAHIGLTQDFAEEHPLFSHLL
jgi:hypothetical protein